MNKHSYSRLREQKGFTLVETVCALALLLVVILGFTIMVTAAGKININAAAVRRSFDLGVRQMTVQAEGELDVSDGIVVFNIEGSNYSFPVKFQSTKSESADKPVYFEKFTLPSIPAGTP